MDNIMATVDPVDSEYKVPKRGSMFKAIVLWMLKP